MTEENNTNDQENDAPEESGAAAGSGGGDLKPDEKTMGMIAHLLGIVCCLGALVIWLLKKEESPFIDDQGKEAINWQITVVGALVAITIIGFIPIVGWIIGFIGGPLVFIVNVVFCVMAGLAANKGERYRYPFAIRLIK